MLNTVSVSAAAQQQYTKSGIENGCIAAAPVSDVARQLSRMETAAQQLDTTIANLVQRLDVVLIPEGPAVGLGGDVNAKTDGSANTHLAQQLYNAAAHLSAMQRRVDSVIARLGI